MNNKDQVMHTENREIDEFDRRVIKLMAGIFYRTYKKAQEEPEKYPELVENFGRKVADPSK